MKFKLIESNNTNKLYRCENSKRNGIVRPSEEGHHYSLSYEAALESLPELPTKDSIWECELNSNLVPLYIDDDLGLWSGYNIAELLLCKLDNKQLIYSDGYKIGPEKVHINNLDEQDREILNSFYQDDLIHDINNLDAVFDFLRKKGYNSIIYDYWEVPGIKAVLLDNKDCGLIKDKHLVYPDNQE